MNQTKNFYTDDFIREIPKTDLHLHLDGSLRISSLIDMAKSSNVELPSYTEEGLRELVFKDQYNNLGEYLHGFMYTCAVLRSVENLERCAYELAIDNQNDGVRYIEVRFAPQLLVDNVDLTMEVVLDHVNKGLSRARSEFNQREGVKNGDEPPFEYGIIACAMRMFGASNFSPYYTKFYSLHRYSEPMEVIKLGAVELAKAVVKIRNERGIPIVGFDLAGREDGYPAEEFKEAYAYVHKNFMHKTVHAGEAYGAESIFQAITELYADRLGHCYYLFDTNRIQDPQIKDRQDYVEKLVSFIAEKRATIEVCLTSNLQTNTNLKCIKDHTLKKMLEKRLSVSICTDNRLMSNTSISKETKLALDNFNITPDVLKNITIYGFKRSFYPGQYNEKRRYVRQIMSYYDLVAKKFNIKNDTNKF
ncbi:MAG: adenosine deaminase family protein [Oligoflexia bacterium]|nr:adenosine deaminase family protein [Oligoflexia bacterium]